MARHGLILWENDATGSRKVSKCLPGPKDPVKKSKNVKNIGKIEKYEIPKGVKNEVKKKHLRHEQYKDSLFNLKTILIKQNIIKSKKHTISTYHITKVGLSTFDTKRWIEADNVHTLAYGHYKTQ